MINRLLTILEKYTTYLIRPKNIALLVGMFLVGIGASPDILSKLLNIIINFVSYKFNIPNQSVVNETPKYLEYISPVILIFGFIILIYLAIDYIRENKKTKTIAIEHIGLRKRIATPLSSCIGKAEIIPIDLIDFYENENVSNPNDALNLTKMSIERTLKSKVSEIGNKEVKIIYGGMPPVGLGFFAGYLLNNTSHVEVWDYDRYAKNGKNWYKVESYADTNKPIIIKNNYTKEKDVCILISISYPVTIEQVRAKVSYPSYIEIKMSEIKYDSMSSIEKITSFEKEFGNLLKDLAADGTERVHIFCAAQASFNFCMGRQVTRNHPAIIVYEYDRINTEKYPWGVLFNTGDNTSPVIV